MSDGPSRCPSCQGTHLSYGRIGTNRHTFMPESHFKLFGYSTKAFVCLHCGYMGHFVEERTLKKLRSREGFGLKGPLDEV